MSHQVVKKGTCRLELSDWLNCTLVSEPQKLFVCVLICVHETFSYREINLKYENIICKNTQEKSNNYKIIHNLILTL